MKNLCVNVCIINFDGTFNIKPNYYPEKPTITLNNYHYSPLIKPAMAVRTSSALIYIAQERGFFAQNGLAVTIREFDPPALGVMAMIHGELDIASSTEYPVVLNAFNGENISIISTHARVQSVSILGRKDRGIANISDLRGTIADFFLGRLLTLHKMGLVDVTLVDVPPGQFFNAIRDTKIDALICWEPFTSEILERMGDDVIEWSVDSRSSGSSLPEMTGSPATPTGGSGFWMRSIQRQSIFSHTRPNRG